VGSADLAADVLLDLAVGPKSFESSSLNFIQSVHQRDATHKIHSGKRIGIHD
jgi:hypothetical protein